ncbi:MAG: hypothetical protein O9325_08090 [Roseomonas sp.]|nr:hypothetical protein [Roseomonas sp.]
MARKTASQPDEGDDQDKRGRFVRLAEKRTANAIKAIRLVGNLSNKAHYEFTEADIRKIIGALGAEVDGLKRRFSDTSSKTTQIFKL